MPFWLVLFTGLPLLLPELSKHSREKCDKIVNVFKTSEAHCLECFDHSFCQNQRIRTIDYIVFYADLFV